jgi:glycosyltransferase involved in cell wall biosynthesis
LRILHVIQELRTGGAEQVVISVSKGARAAGHEVAVAAAPGELEERTEGEIFPVRLIERRPGRIVGAGIDVHRALRAWKPDLVHAHNPGMALASGLATVRTARVPGLVTVHGNPDEEWPRSARLLRLSGLPAVACGPGVAVALEEHGCAPLAMVPNAVGPAPAPAKRATLERDWQLAPQTRLLVSVGRLVEQKNHRLGIRALAGVPDASLVIVGEGPLRGALEHEAREVGVDERVVFAGQRTDARAIMGASDAVVLSSHWEGLPLTGMEALAGGTPLVATAVRGLRELVSDGVNALLVPPDDPEALAAALRRVLDDAALRARLAENGHRLAAGATEEKMVTAYLDLYERLTA